jgi:hypothetical protein
MRGFHDPDAFRMATVAFAEHSRPWVTRTTPARSLFCNSSGGPGGPTPPSNYGRVWTCNREQPVVPRLSGVALLDSSCCLTTGAQHGKTRLSAGVPPQGPGPGRRRKAIAEVAKAFGRHCCVAPTLSTLKRRPRYWIRSPRPARRTRRPTAGPLAPLPPARSGRGEGSAPTHARR